MDAIFPLNLPAPTMWYVVLYVLTLLLHVVFMSYVLAGSIMLGIAGLRGMLGRAAGDSPWVPVTTILKDWMPFALSAAITAGVAPLLFVQILYQQEFYTANLLSFHRWMAILPVLIVAFYLLYLLKADRIEGRTALQGIVAVLIMGAVLFVAWSWTENHLLSLDRAAWPRQYEKGRMIYASTGILPRIGFWIVSALATGCLLIAWQIRAGASGVDVLAPRRVARSLGAIAFASLPLVAASGWFVLQAPGAAGVATPLWMTVSGLGSAIATISWAMMVARGVLGTGLLIAASAGTGMLWFGALLVREATRLKVIGLETVSERHDSVGTLAGFAIFLVFAFLGVGTIGWIVRMIQVRGKTQTE